MPTVIVVVLNHHSEWWETPSWLSLEKGFIVLFYLSERFGRFMCATWNTLKIFCRNAVSSSIKYLKSSFCSSKTILNAYSMECLSNGRSYALPILNFLVDTGCRMHFNDRGRVLSFFWHNVFQLNRLLSSTATYFAYVITKCWKFVPIPC